MYSHIQLYENIDSDYIWSVKGTMSDEEIESFIASLGGGTEKTDPEWNSDTVFLATFNDGNLRADNPAILNSVVGYKIQRKDFDHDVRIELGSFDGKTSGIKDYSVANNTTSQYYIAPIFEVDGVKTYGDPVLSDPVIVNYDGWSVMRLLPGNNKNEYIVDKNNIWFFDLNAETEPYVLNSDKQFADGIGRYSKVVAGERMYLTSAISALIGHVDCKGEYVSDDVTLIKKFYEFCNTPSLKLLKDIKGNVLIVDIEAQPKAEIDNRTNAKQTTVAFKFREVENIENIIVKGLAS